MPIYEYRCEKCGNVFELLEPTFSEVYEKRCVKCGANAERIMSLTSFKLKGSGWYKTDYASTSSACNSKESSQACSTCPVASGDNQ